MDDVLQQNPELMKQFAEAAVGSMNKGPQQGMPGQQQQQQRPPPSMEPPNPLAAMMGLGGGGGNPMGGMMNMMMGGLGGGGPPRQQQGGPKRTNSPARSDMSGPDGIDDLIELGLEFKDGLYNPHTRYNINLFKVAKLVKPLCELKKMIGMVNIKKDIFDILMYQLQEFDTKKDMLHTVIEGEPGVGKTELTKIIAKIYQSMGYLSNNIIKFVKRSDLIGGYLGQTAIKTQKILDECKGGVLIIDEAYSLGNPEGRDSYSKECIDTLTAYLSECPETIVFIIGYKEALDKCFFSVNKGLERRFGYRFSIDKYEPNHLKLILFKIIEENDWYIDKDDIDDKFFEKNKDYFIFNGGDMLNLFTKSKFSHSKRFFREKLEYNSKKYLNMEDIENGFKMLMEDSKFADRKNSDPGFKEYIMYS